MARRRKKQTSLDTSPHNPSGREMLVKWFLWLIIGTVIAFLVFIVLVLVGWIIEQALATSLSWEWSVNPLFPLILMVIAFLGTFIGNLILTGTLNLIYTTKYYDMAKMFSITLLINVLVFIFFIPIYLLFVGTIEPLMLILSFHVIMAVFMCYCGIEITTNPNYAASSLVWSVWGLSVAVFIFALAFKLINVNWGQQVNILLALPPVLAYLCIPFFQTVWEKVYYKFYSMWNNFLYIPSLHEVMVDAEDTSDINVDL